MNLNPTMLNVRIKDSHGDQTCFQLDSTTKLSEIFNSYAQKLVADVTSLAFTFDGVPIDDAATPFSLELEDQDQIDCRLIVEPSSPPAKRQKITAAPFAASLPCRTLLSSFRWVNNVPELIWVYKIFNPFLDLKALSTLRRCNTFFEEYWQHVLKLNIIRVPEGCPTMNHAMDLAFIFSLRKECTKENPVKIVVGEGEHVMVAEGSPDGFMRTFDNFMHVSCDNITVVGKGKGKTTILGGFYVDGKQNVNIEQLGVTNPDGHGLFCQGRDYSENNVDVMECSFKKCKYNGMYVESATVTATQCEFMENGSFGVMVQCAKTKIRLNDCTIHHNGNTGLVAYNRAVVDLHGTKTDIHSNEGNGIWAEDRGQVNIHLPSQHNTSHDNVGEDRRQTEGGSIANINADGTFTHVVFEDDGLTDTDAETTDDDGDY